MAKNNTRVDPATEIATRTRDAYSFKYYGASYWRGCCAMLLARGYNAVEASAIMRSKLTRIAADGRIPMSSRYAAPRDLASLLDSLAEEREIVDDYVLGIMTEDDDAPTPMPSRGTLRLAWSRPTERS